MKFEVGMYVRTNNNGIDKIRAINNDFLLLDKIPQSTFKGNVIKSTFNIIDLIEVGDYINGYKITLLTENHDVAYAEDEEGYLIKSFNNSNIKSIVTKEQFSSMEYMLGDK